MAPVSVSPAFPAGPASAAFWASCERVKWIIVEQPWRIRAPDRARQPDQLEGQLGESMICSTLARNSAHNLASISRGGRARKSVGTQPAFSLHVTQWRNSHPQETH